MTPEDMVITAMEGKKVSGRRNPSSELQMHLMIYQHRTDVNVVCQRNPAATGYAAAGVPLNKALLVRIDPFAGLRSGGAVWHAGNSGISATALPRLLTVTTRSCWRIMAW